MIDAIIKEGYKQLNLIQFLTAGEDEVRCWTIRQGTNAKNASGAIHTDFAKNFICAEHMTFDDLAELGSENEVKNKGLLTSKGKTYTVQDGDIFNFKIGIGKK